MKFILTCGGTAGHINPALAVAGRLRELLPDCEILFIGAEGKMEMDLVPREGYEIRPLRITNLSRGHHLSDISHNLQTLKNVVTAEREARKLIREFQPDVVIGTGGYVCYPVLKEARKQHVPTAIHESNAVPGLTTKMLAGDVDSIMVGFEESRRYYPDPDRVTVTGTPVRGEFSCYTQDTAKRDLGLEPDTPLVVSVWGSLGAEHMNGIMTEMLGLMKGQKDFRLIHAIGSRYMDFVEKRLAAEDLEPADSNAELREYIYDMPRVMAAADLILCRAGASTLAELCYMGKPVILVPSPNVTNNHQEKNARVLENAGGAKVFLEGEFDAQTLLEQVRELLQNTEKRQGMQEAMLSLANRDATDQICDIILGLAHR